MTERDPDQPRFNERLDHLQARRPFLYNLATGAVIGLVLVLFGVDSTFVALYVLSWATLRAYLWRDGRVLRRQYEMRTVRMEAAKAERRRRT